ncbi:MAG: chloride channel protein [Thermoplasmata archaeon]|nr:chloride channel protein [Thermoplasmata archaeon]
MAKNNNLTSNPITRVMRRGQNMIHKHHKQEVKEYAILGWLAIIVGMIAGIGAVVFRYMINYIGRLFGFHSAGPFSFLESDLGWMVFIAPAMGGLIVGLLVWKFASEAKGHGVPEVMGAMIANEGKIRPRVGLVKIFASAICIGSGGSAGREGPIVQIGATGGSALGQALGLSPSDTRTLLACGAAAGIAATFNAPLGAMMFAIELILLEFRTRSFIPLVISSVTATIVAHAVFGVEIAFPIRDLYTLTNPLVEMPLYILLGIICGLAAILFVYLLYKFEDAFDNMKMPEYFKPMVGGLALGLVGLASYYYLGHYYVFGTGYGTMMPILDPTSPIYGALGTDATYSLLFLLIGLALLKIFATSLTLGSGGSGGVFAPSLFIGAAVGGAFGVGVNIFFPEVSVSYGAYALVGMAAVFSGTSRATLTAILIMFEMTSNYQIILPLMFACVVSDGVTKILSKDTIYTKKLNRKGIRYSYEREINILETISVGDVMVRNVTTAKENMKVREVSNMILESGFQGFPCICPDGKLVGIVTHSDVRKAMAAGMADASICDVETKKGLEVVYPDMTLEEAMELMTSMGFGHIPVVSREEPDKLVGFLTRNDILKVYKDKKGERKKTWL